MVVDALPVLEQVMRMMSLVAQEKGTELTYRAEGTCTMLATRDEIHQIIYNLTDNAVKYTPPGSTVQVSLFREGDQVVLTVEDNGAGIPEEDLPRIFERFYRVDKARSRAAGGTGLGLAIVRDTVEKRGGTVEAANRPGGGATTIAHPQEKLGEMAAELILEKIRKVPEEESSVKRLISPELIVRESTAGKNLSTETKK